MKTPKDIRSTGRKRARAVLFSVERLFVCCECGRSQNYVPPEKPAFLDSFWPEESRVLSSSLQANHINKNLLDCDPANLEWLCASCHKLKDSQTDKGVSVIENEFGY